MARADDVTEAAELIRATKDIFAGSRTNQPRWMDLFLFPTSVGFGCARLTGESVDGAAMTKRGATLVWAGKPSRNGARREKGGWKGERGACLILRQSTPRQWIWKLDDLSFMFGF